MNFMKIDGLQADSCTQYETSLDVMTIIPRPISAFKKCAYIQSCRSKCQAEIDWFYAKKLNVANPNVSPIRSALMALVPAWVSQFENLDEQFVPIAVQDYGARENCDHYIVVIGRPLYHAQCADAPWTRYIFCYLDETAALAVIAKIVLPVTKDFVLSRSELADKKQLTGYGEFQLVSELFLPPLSDIDDRGGLVAVWDNAGTDTGVKHNNNGIFEIFVNSQDTVHES